MGVNIDDGVFGLKSFTGVEAFLARFSIFQAPLGAVFVRQRYVGEEVAVERCLLPSFGPPQVVLQTRSAFVVRNLIHVFVNL